ncbi:hypothetical protein ASE00_05080 [Sphingomonas sp. Root710]|uniref:HepT-like ribonuclease domain-containing protein n=1 Tax=Sphingomonas sp. Root710 TaxID=1736594 RepID=UPI0006FBB0F8|nr:HepT-like ribonuclease domain-containing protein [Sphingomonas sp. Root710]KRB86115.1 hypothetical protein ASE00_05080 [Sphingomonas sp. Root710]
MHDRDIDLLEQILDLIAAIKRRTIGLDRGQFEIDRDETDLVAFRLAHIGEASHKLSVELQERHPDIDWRSIYGMRNVIAHDYGAILPRLLWKVVTTDLDILQSACRQEFDRLTS